MALTIKITKRIATSAFSRNENEEIALWMCPVPGIWNSRSMSCKYKAAETTGKKVLSIGGGVLQLLKVQKELPQQ